MLRTILTLCLVGGCLAQPPLATTAAPGSFFHQVGGVITDTASSLGGAFTDYVKDEGKNILHNVLPDLAGNFIHDGFWSILNAIKDTAGKRDVTSGVEELHDMLTVGFQKEFWHGAATAKADAAGQQLYRFINFAVKSLQQGHMSNETFLGVLPLLKGRGERILKDFAIDINQQLVFIGFHEGTDVHVAAVKEALDKFEREGRKVLYTIMDSMHRLVDPDFGTSTNMTVSPS